MAEAFDPYYVWLGIRPDDRPPTHYALLGIARFESDEAVIANAADRQMAFVKTFHTGEHSADSQRLLSELARAKLCLLQRDRKQAYDAQLNSFIAPPIASTPPPVGIVQSMPIVPLVAPVYVSMAQAPLSTSPDNDVFGESIAGPAPKIHGKRQSNFPLPMTMGGGVAFVALAAIIFQSTSTPPPSQPQPSTPKPAVAEVAPSKLNRPESKRRAPARVKSQAPTDAASDEDTAPYKPVEISIPIAREPKPPERQPARRVSQNVVVTLRSGEIVTNSSRRISTTDIASRFPKTSQVFVRTDSNENVTGLFTFDRWNLRGPAAEFFANKQPHVLGAYKNGREGAFHLWTSSGECVFTVEYENSRKKHGLCILSRGDALLLVQQWASGSIRDEVFISDRSEGPLPVRSDQFTDADRNAFQAAKIKLIELEEELNSFEKTGKADFKKWYDERTRGLVAARGKTVRSASAANAAAQDARERQLMDSLLRQSGS